MKYALLIHLLDWKLEEDEFILDDGLIFVNTEAHRVGKLYNDLCLLEKLDDGDPFSYSTALIFFDESQKDPSFFPTESYYSLSTTFINLLTIICRGTQGQCRVISTKNDFETSHGTYTLYEGRTEFIDELIVTDSEFDKKISELLKALWGNLKSAYLTNNQKPRIDNALNFFYLSWNTLTLQQTGICLSIVLETLFSPHSNSEVIHQIAYNVSRFKGHNKEGRIEVYKYVKKYYSIRSKLVHGDVISEEENNSIPKFFNFICELILVIISDKDLIHIFNDNLLRKNFLEDKLFE